MKEDDAKIIQKYGKIEGGGGVADPAAISFTNHAKNISAFINAIEEGKTFELEGAEARKAVALILDIYNAADKRIIIKAE